MIDNKVLFKAITKGYELYAHKKSAHITENAATKTFISILKANGVNFTDDDTSGNDVVENMGNAEPLQRYLQPLTNVQQENIAIALAEYCFAGGGPLYDEIKSNVEITGALTAQTQEDQDSEVKIKKSKLNIAHNIDLLDAPIVIENLDHGKAITFLKNSLEQTADSNHSAIWLFILIHSILEPDTIINNHTFMTYWFEKSNKQSNEQLNEHLNYARSIQRLNKDLDTFFKGPYTELHGKILSVPHIKNQNATRLQEAAYVCSAGGARAPSAGYTPETREEAKSLIIKMLQIPGISVKYEPGMMWIEVLMHNVTEKIFKEILDAIPGSMLEEFYQKNLHHTTLEKIPDYLTITPYLRTQFHHRCLLSLKILEGKNNPADQALKLKIEQTVAIAKNLPCAEITIADRRETLTAAEYFIKQLKFSESARKSSENPDEKNILLLAYLVANIIHFLAHKGSYNDILDNTPEAIANQILVENQALKTTMAIESDFMKNICDALYESIKQSFIILNNTSSILGFAAPVTIDCFIKFIYFLDSTFEAKTKEKSSAMYFNFLKVNKLSENADIQRIITDVFMKMLLSANATQVIKIQSSAIYKITNLGEIISAKKIMLQNIYYAIRNYNYTYISDYCTGDKFSLDNEMKDLVKTQITATLKLIKPSIDYYDQEKTIALKKILDAFFNNGPLKVSDFEKDIQIIYSFFAVCNQNIIDNDAKNVILTGEHHTFIATIQQKAVLYKSSWGNWMKSIANSGESMGIAEFIAALPYKDQDDRTKKSSLVKAIIMLMSYRLMSYQSASHNKTFYHDNLKPAFEGLSPISLSDTHKAVILFEIERALNVRNLAFLQNDNRLQLLALDLGFFIKTFGLDRAQINSILYKSKFFALSGTSGAINTTAYGQMMLTGTAGDTSSRTDDVPVSSSSSSTYRGSSKTNF